MSVAANATATIPTAVNVPATLALESKNELLLDAGGLAADVAEGVAICVIYLVDTSSVDEPPTVWMEITVVAYTAVDARGVSEDCWPEERDSVPELLEVARPSCVDWDDDEDEARFEAVCEEVDWSWVDWEDGDRLLDPSEELLPDRDEDRGLLEELEEAVLTPPIIMYP